MAATIGSEYTSNTLLTEDDEIGEWIILPGVNLTAEQDTASLEMDVRYDYTRRMFTKDYWQDENRLTGDAAIEWHAIAERLDFFASNVRTESTERARQAETPANRQVVGTTDAGGRLLFQPREADELQIEYLFRDINAAETSTDSQRHNGTLRYLLGLSENRGLILQGTYSDIDYEGLFPDAEYTVAMIGYRQTTGSLELELNAGYNWYDRVDRGSTGNPAFDGTLTWHVNGNRTFTLSGSQLITDQSSELASGDSATENTDVNAAFEETQARMGYRHAFGPNTISVEGFWVDQQYADDVPLSNSRLGVGMDFSRALTRSADLRVYAELSNRDYEDEGDDQDELRAGFRVEHRFGRSLDFDWGGRYETRDAELGVSYDVWYGDLNLTWTFLGARRAPR